MPRQLPALENSSWLRFGTLCLLYVCQGLPVGLFQVAIPVWFAAEGLSVGEIGGFIAVVFLPWSFKLVAGPVMDRFTFPAMGRRRPWVLLAQVGLILSFVLMAVIAPDPKSSYWLLASLGFVCNAFGALQDVAVDGMAIDILKEDERAQANAYMFGGQIAGISAASAIGGAALMNYGLAPAAVLMAIAVFLIMLLPLLLREREGERILPWTQGAPSVQALADTKSQWRDIFGSLLRNLILPMSILLVVLEGLNRAASGITVAINPVIAVQELGFSQIGYANWYATAGIIAAVFGVLLAPLIDRFGAQRTLGLVVGFRFILFSVIALFPDNWVSMTYFNGYILMSYMSGQLVTITIIALFMKLCFKPIAATQFAVYMASANLTLSLGSALVAPLAEITDYVGMFMFVAGLNLCFLLLLPLLNFERHATALNEQTYAVRNNAVVGTAAVNLGDKN